MENSFIGKPSTPFMFDAIKVGIGMIPINSRTQAQIYLDLISYPCVNYEDNELYYFEYNGLKCRIKRDTSLSWCGQVELPKNNKNALYINVYGGIRYGDGEMIGFCCRQKGDISPLSFLLDRDNWNKFYCGTYRDYSFVLSETIKLARQLSGHF